MPTLSLKVYYRPIRIGWCVRNDNWEDLRKALRLTHTLWGGRYNPVIPVDNAGLAAALVELFRVDALYPVADDNRLHNFIAQFPWLPWPSFYKDLFVQGSRGTIATFLDIYHPVRHLFEEHIKRQSESKFSATQYDWEVGDPLGDVFLCTFGRYPSKDEIAKDYADFVERNLRGQRIQLKATEEVDPNAFRMITPSALTTHMLNWETSPDHTYPGFYVGDAKNFEDILNFWNIRASDADVFFFDPAHEVRLEKFKNDFLTELGRRPADAAGWKNHVAIWADPGRTIDRKPFGETPLGFHGVSKDTWNGYNLKPARFYIDNKYSALASIDEDREVPKLSVQLPEKPFFTEPELHNQQVVVTIWPIGGLDEQSEFTFETPFIPKLNPFYGKRMYFEWNKTRVETPGLAVISSVTSDQVSLRSLSQRELMASIFEAFGVNAETSKPGRIASRLIHQMGGVQGCRVFKIPGVRDLIEEFGPQTSFTRSNAVQTIGRNDPKTGAPQFSEYENLYIEFREPGVLKPEHAFTFLLKRGVFQTGLSLICPNCELEFWIHLDDVASETRCELCGKTFLISPQLRDRDWRYRRSGLFGSSNHQEGSIPVVVTLQQIDTALSSAILATNMNLRPKTAPIEECETDLIVLEQHYFEDRVSIAIGECKTGGYEVSQDDVRKLSKVADALQGERLDTFIIFAKLAAFSPEEIARCREAQGQDRYRVIMLSERELEPYFTYERTAKEFAISSTAISLQDLASTTHDVFFEPKMRPKLAP